MRNRSDGLHWFYEDGRMVVVNPDSGNNCSGPLFMAYLDSHSRPERERKAKETERQRIKADDRRVLGSVFGRLAQEIRKQRVARKKPIVLKRTQRRNRHRKDT